MVATNQIKNLEHHTFSWVTSCPRCLSNPLKSWKKHRKVRLLSSPLKNQRFPQGFSHFWPIALAFCSAHAGSVHGACSVVFRVAHRNSSRFSSRASRQITGVLNVPAWYLPMSVEVVGFELGV